LINENRKGSLYGSYFTIILAIAFTIFQGLEYKVSSFTLSDGIFGSCFFFGTGFHGLHVIIGTVFILIGLIRILNYQLTHHHHCGFEFAIFY
jgi:cytochrome c oxidase subunit 3